MEGQAVDLEEVENRGRGKKGEIHSQRNRTKNLAVAGNKEKSLEILFYCSNPIVTFG